MHSHEKKSSIVVCNYLFSFTLGENWRRNHDALLCKNVVYQLCWVQVLALFYLGRNCRRNHDALLCKKSSIYFVECKYLLCFTFGENLRRNQTISILLCKKYSICYINKTSYFIDLIDKTFLVVIGLTSNWKWKAVYCYVYLQILYFHFKIINTLQEHGCFRVS